MNDKPVDQQKPDVEDGDNAEKTAEDKSIAVAEKTKPGDKTEAEAKTQTEAKPDNGKSKSAASKKTVKQRRGFPWFGLFNFLLILLLATAAGYYWQLQQNTEKQKQAAFDALRQQIASKADSSEISSGLRPLESGLGEIASRIEQLQQHQEELQTSSEKLFDLYGRDESDWKLAEVEYLMRVAQHKLILENDFEGAALTLGAASDRIAATGDLGLLPVRVKISDEIAELKTRKRADLVGMTLKLAQLSQQIRVLKPGFKPVIELQDSEPGAAASTDQESSILDKTKSFFSSLVNVKREDGLPPTQTEALIINVGEKLEDNLKLTRWSVLERDSFQYRRLMQENIELFEQFYTLDDAANNDFYAQLKELAKAEIKPEKPDINGSLDMLKKIKTKRDNAVEELSSEVGSDV